MSRQVRRDQRAERREVVAAFLHDDGRQPRPTERRTVPGHQQRALRVVRGGVDAQGDDRGGTASRDHPLDQVVDGVDPTVVPRVLVQWQFLVAPPTPLSITVHDGSLDLPLRTIETQPAPTFQPGAAPSSEDPADVSWTVTRDVLRSTTTWAVQHGAEYDVPHDGHACEQYAGEVVVDRATFAQHAFADCTYLLIWPGVDVR